MPLIGETDAVLLATLIDGIGVVRDVSIQFVTVPNDPSVIGFINRVPALLSATDLFHLVTRAIDAGKNVTVSVGYPRQQPVEINIP